MALGNRSVTDLPVLTSISDGWMYVATGGVDYRVALGGTNGVVYTDASGNINLKGSYNTFTGAPATQTVLQSYGRNDNVVRWRWVLEASDVLSLYSYNTSGGVPTQSAFIKSVVAGGANEFHVNGLLVCGTGDGDKSFSPTNDADIWDVNIANTMGIKGVGDTTQGYFSMGNSGTRVFGWNGSNWLFAGSNVSINGTLTVSNTSNLSISGNAGSATKLQTARTINGVPFDGTANITLPAGSTTWGSITGTLSSQSDLQSALNSKATDSNTVHISGNENITGTKTMNALSVSSNALHVGSGATAWNGQGAYMGWNRSGSGLSGETDFINHKGLGNGGWIFWNTDGTTYTNAASISGTGAATFNSVTATSFAGSLSGNASSATLASKASTLAAGGGNGTAMTFNWSGQGGQPSWLWGGNDGSNMYVYNPSNFSVNYANSAGSANTANSASSASSVPWGGVSGKPTTLGGYGITDAVQNASGVASAQVLTQAAYNAIGSKDPNRLYIIVG